MGISRLKLFNRACWITLLIAYIFPAREYTDSMSLYGYPFGFLIVYPQEIINNSLFNSCLFEIGKWIVDAFIIYVILYYLDKLIEFIKLKFTNKKH